ncbi:unnamed protein product [Linum tenue]|uniref:S-protein homolog n=1 Tax=Linum tenue TaxID=586396 RepID=A0AAV0L2C6_9ROSI|nr:unnamed protein product [Linum tenue]
MTCLVAITIIHRAIFAAVVLQATMLKLHHHFTAAKYHEATIHVTNRMSGSMALIVHCRSKDDDLGARAVEAGASFGFSFGQNVVGDGTVFWCKAAFRDRRLSFTAFDEDDHSSYVKEFEVADRFP